MMSFHQGHPLWLGRRGAEGAGPHAVGSLGHSPVRALPVGLAGVRGGGRGPLGRALQGRDPSVLPALLPQPGAVFQGRLGAFLLVGREGGDSRRHSQEPAFPGIPAGTARAPGWHFHLAMSSSC